MVQVAPGTDCGASAKSNPGVANCRGELQFLGDRETSQKMFRGAYAVIRQLAEDASANPKYIDALAAGQQLVR
jgi:hypothetical protein